MNSFTLNKKITIFNLGKIGTGKCTFVAQVINYQLFKMCPFLTNKFGP
jgi:signal recognition particle receptor subunit beta